jgi:hypothetical protein
MATPLFATYAFADVSAQISGPGAQAFTISGPDTAAAEEGITITWGEEMNTQSIGADGSVMNSMHSSMAGTCNIRLQKISPVNAMLSHLINVQRLSSALWARNIITIRDVARNDLYTLLGCAWVRFPVNSYAKVGNVLDYELHVPQVDPNLGKPLQTWGTGPGGVMSGFPGSFTPPVAGLGPG